MLGSRASTLCVLWWGCASPMQCSLFPLARQEAQGAPLGSAAYQLGPGGRHSAADWQRFAAVLRHGAIGTHRAHPCACSEARAQMAQEAPEAKRKPGKKLFGEVRFLWALVLTGAVSGAYRGLTRARMLRLGPRQRCLGRTGQLQPHCGVRVSSKFAVVLPRLWAPRRGLHPPGALQVGRVL